MRCTISDNEYDCNEKVDEVKEELEHGKVEIMLKNTDDIKDEDKYFQLEALAD